MPERKQSGSGGESHGTAAVVAALGANILIAVVKFIAAFAGGSSAMLAEGLHSTADSANQALLLLGDHVSKRPPDHKHPFGHGHDLYFWSLIVAIVLFGMGGGFSIYEGIRHISEPAELRDPTWSYVVLGIAFLAESTALLFSLHKFRKRYPGKPFWRALHASKDPRLFIPIGEDTAALAGIVVAFAGLFLAHRLDAPIYDAAASMVIGAILATVALFLAVETRGLLVGEAVTPEVRDDIRAAAESDDDVEAVRRIVTMHLGPGEILLAMDIRFRPALSMDALSSAIERLESRIREDHPRVNRIFLEAAPLARP